MVKKGTQFVREWEKDRVVGKATNWDQTVFIVFRYQEVKKNGKGNSARGVISQERDRGKTFGRRRDL